MRKTLCIGALLLISACACTQKPDQEEMFQKASALTKLSKAVEATVRYRNPPADITSQELIDLSTRDDPSLKAPFADHVLKVLRHNRHSIVLVCSKENRGLLEDSACTAELDRHLWKESSAQCEFTLSIESICSH